MAHAVRISAVIAACAFPALGCTSLLGDYEHADGALGQAAAPDGGTGGPAGPDGGTVADDARTTVEAGQSADVAGPPPAALVTGQTNLRGLVVDAANVYFTRYEPAADVTQVPLDGGAPLSLGAGIDGATALALDGAGLVYWTSAASNGTWQLFDAKIGVAGSARALLAPVPAGVPHGLAVDATRTFVGQVSSSGYAAVFSFPHVGGPPATLANGPGKLGDVRERGGDVVWADTANGRVYSVSKSPGSSVVALATGMVQPTELVVAGDTVIWINHGAIGASSISAATVGVAGSHRVLAKSLPSPAGIATDGARVFWTDAVAGELLSMRLDGGDVHREIGGIAQPGALAVTASHLVWYAAADGSIWARGR